MRAGRDIAVTGTAETPRLVNPTDVISLENEYVELIPTYGQHRLPLKEGGKVFADGSLALNEFYTQVQARKKREHFVQPKYWLLEPKNPEVTRRVGLFQSTTG